MGTLSLDLQKWVKQEADKAHWLKLETASEREILSYASLPHR